MKPNKIANWPSEADRRHSAAANRPTLAGIPIRDEDVEPATGLHWVAKLCRVTSGILVLLMVLQVVNGLTSMVDISVGVLLAEAIRLIIMAGLLWGAGALADLFVQSHRDLRATRILIRRMTHVLERTAASTEQHTADEQRAHGDASR